MTKRNAIQKIIDNGTPAFLFDESAFQRRVREIDTILNGGDGSDLNKEAIVKPDNITDHKRIGICYAAKANPFLLTAAAKATDRLEICSQGEMDIVDALSIDGKMVLYSGVSKTAEDIRKAISQGMRHATAESLLHLELLQQEAERAQVTLWVLLRLNSGAQFGMKRADIEKALEQTHKYPALQIEGIHYFCGTQRRKLKQQEDELLMLEGFVKDLREKYGLALPKLEYGPGLPVPYFEGEDFDDTLLPIKSLAPALRRAARWAEVTVEMGRFFSAPCGTYFSAVTDLKDTEDAHIAILDGGIHQLTYAGQMMGMKIPKMHVIHRAGTCPRDEKTGCEEGKTDDLAKQHYMLCGSLCTTGDVLVRDVELPRLQMGDVLAFENVGAYTVTEGIGLFLSHALPAVYLFHEDRTGEELMLARGPMPTSKINTLQDL